tara:strand:+ start:8893 stop:9204 length:312 start_codon:yes stop_codon:yes gene_type:complete
MTEFDNVSIVKEANIYFEGQVISHTVKFSDGTIKTLGVMLPGEYEFSTQKKEQMEILNGELDVLLPRQSNWVRIVEGETFDVPATSTFNVRIHQITDYCCSYE